MPRIDDAGGIVHDESDAGQTALPGDLNEILTAPDVVTHLPEYRLPGEQHEFLTVGHLHFFRFRKDLFHRIDNRGLMRFGDRKLIVQNDIIACRTETLDIEIADDDRSFLDSLLDIAI